jgi:acetyl/propionyl-CoA carboxylase alpha subunit
MKKISLEINGNKINVLAQKISGELWFHLNGVTHQYRPEIDQNKSSQQKKNSDPAKIFSPMPGKIIKVNKKQNDSVKKGETIIVMEAMKMEYNLKSSLDTKITKIHCQENQTVSLGDCLVEMEEI